MIRPRCLVALFCLATTAHALAHDVGAQMLTGANWFLSSLNADQKAKAVFAFDSEERLNWHFIPRERKGLPIKEMTQEQRLLAHALLNTGLSEAGYQKAATIMSMEEVLYQIEGDAAPDKRDETRKKRDPERYFFSIFGTPSDKGLWGWRVEGHHLSMNFTIKDGKTFCVTPSFFGSNPGEVRQGPRTGTRILSHEEDLGRKLAVSLNADQWKKADVDETAPKEMITEAKHKVDPLSPEGISESDLNPEQKDLLQQIVHEFLFRMRPELAEENLKTIQASSPIHFAWAGSREKGQAHYYRIQGKTFLLEYDDTQNEANHIHTVWRDFNGDFGYDLLAEHLKAEHAK